MINSNLGLISHQDTVIFILELLTKNCVQTAADRNIVTVDSLYELKLPASYLVTPLPTPYDLPFSYNTARLVGFGPSRSFKINDFQVI